MMQKKEKYYKYFCSVFGKKWNDVSISYSNSEILSIPVAPSEDVKHQLLECNTFERYNKMHWLEVEAKQIQTENTATIC